MGYCSIGDLRDNIGGLTANSTKAPQSFLQGQINRKCSHINSMIGRRYKLPITEADHADAFNILKDICIELVRASVAIRLSVATSTVKQKPESGMAAKAEKRLMEIKEGRYDLPGVPLCDDCSRFESGSYDDEKVDGIPVEIRENKNQLRQTIPR